MATLFASGPALNTRTADVGTILTEATTIERNDFSWALIKEIGDDIDSLNQFMGSGIDYDVDGLPVVGTFTTWINDDYLPGGGVVGWAADGFSVAALPLATAVQANDARMLFSMILNGSDTITGTENGDLIDGYRGDDTIQGELGNDRLFGGQGADRLSGNEGNDVLSGGVGRDRLTGGEGKDKFLFDARFTPANADRITDFDPTQDLIQLSSKQLSASSVILPVGVVADELFTVGAGATSGDHRIIYDDVAGRLYLDADGSADSFGLQLFATIAAGLELSAADFRVV